MILALPHPIPFPNEFLHTHSPASQWTKIAIVWFHGFLAIKPHVLNAIVLEATVSSIQDMLSVRGAKAFCASPFLYGVDIEKGLAG